MKFGFSFSALILLIFSMYCTGAAGGKKAPPGRVGVLKCEGENAVLYRYKKSTGDLIEKGSVTLPPGKKCKKAASEDEKSILRLKREGEWEKFYSGTSAVLEKGPYRFGKKDGLFSYYTKEGKRSRTVNYSKGKKEGEEISYFPGSDDWREKGRNVKGKRNGPWQSRLSSGTDCISEGSYTSGDKTGPWVECSKSEKTKEIYVSFKGSYQSGLKSGKVTTFNAKGNVSGEGSYRPDLACKNDSRQSDKSKCEKKSGRWIFYHENGKKAEEGNYDSKTGRRSGKWTEYYQSGEKMGEGNRDHVRQGKWTFYHKNGKIFGRYKFQGTDFVVVSGEIYEDGVKISESMPEKNCRMIVNRLGRKVKECDREEGGFASSLLKYDRDKDALSVRLKMKRGYWTDYNKKGQKIGEGSYLGGRKDGKWKELEGGRWVTKNYTMGKVR
ncbi:MAG: hypothetical protein OEZ34_08030 [Spirochaetia bacterium]|nr:hypothetical protein [Spirochaetia bacterium]